MLTSPGDLAWPAHPSSAPGSPPPAHPPPGRVTDARRQPCFPPPLMCPVTPALQGPFTPGCWARRVPGDLQGAARVPRTTHSRSPARATRTSRKPCRCRRRRCSSALRGCPALRVRSRGLRDAPSSSAAASATRRPPPGEPETERDRVGEESQDPGCGCPGLPTEGIRCRKTWTAGILNVGTQLQPP